MKFWHLFCIFSLVLFLSCPSLSVAQPTGDSSEEEEMLASIDTHEMVMKNHEFLDQEYQQGLKREKDTEQKKNELVEQAWKELITPTQMKACNARGGVYDRLRKTCISARLQKTGQDWCTREGIETEFKFIQGANEILIDHLNRGFEIDQCGRAANNSDGAVVVLLKKERDTLEYEQRTICVQGSSVCR